MMVITSIDKSYHLFTSNHGSLHLEPICFLGGRGSVPLNQMIIGTIQISVQLDDQVFEEGGELSLRFTAAVFWGSASIIY